MTHVIRHDEVSVAEGATDVNNSLFFDLVNFTNKITIIGTLASKLSDGEGKTARHVTFNNLFSSIRCPFQFRDEHFRTTDLSFIKKSGQSTYE